MFLLSDAAIHVSSAPTSVLLSTAEQVTLARARFTIKYLGRSLSWVHDLDQHVKQQILLQHHERSVHAVSLSLHGIRDGFAMLVKCDQIRHLRSSPASRHTMEQVQAIYAILLHEALPGVYDHALDALKGWAEGGYQRLFCELLHPPIINLMVRADMQGDVGAAYTTPPHAPRPTTPGAPVRPNEPLAGGHEPRPRRLSCDFEAAAGHVAMIAEGMVNPPEHEATYTSYVATVKWGQPTPTINCPVMELTPPAVTYSPTSRASVLLRCLSHLPLEDDVVCTIVSTVLRDEIDFIVGRLHPVWQYRDDAMTSMVQAGYGATQAKVFACASMALPRIKQPPLHASLLESGSSGSAAAIACRVYTASPRRGAHAPDAYRMRRWVCALWRHETPFYQFPLHDEPVGACSPCHKRRGSAITPLLNALATSHGNDAPVVSPLPSTRLPDLTVGIMDVFISARDQPGSDHKQLLIDTGANGHIVHDGTCLVSLKTHRPSRIAIRTGNSVCYSTSIGPACFILMDDSNNEVEITREVLYCPEFRVNLLSPPKDWQTHGTRFDFDDRLRMTLACGRVVPFTVANNVYTLSYRTKTDVTPSLSAFSSAAAPCGNDAALRWHQRLGHPPFPILRLLNRTTADVSLQLTDAHARDMQSSCTTCPHVKMKAAAFKRNPDGSLASSYGDRVHMDLAGPITPLSMPIGGRYASVFVDAFSLHIGAYVLRTKDEQESIHKRYCADMASHGGMAIREFHSDNGGEFTGLHYVSSVIDQGAKRTTTVPYTPNQNALAEGAFWKLFGVVRAFLKESGLPHSMWAHAYVQAAYVLNRTPRLQRKGEPVSSYELLNKRKPSMRPIKVFGCVAHALVEKHNRESKLGDVAVTGIHVGVARYQRGWVLWIPGSHQFIVSRSVRFDEHLMYKDASAILPGQPPVQPREDDDSDEDDKPLTPGPRRVRPPSQELCRTPGCAQRIFHLGPCGGHVAGGGLPSANLRGRLQAGVPPPAAPGAPPANQPEPDVAPVEANPTMQDAPTMMDILFCDLYDEVGVDSVGASGPLPRAWPNSNEAFCASSIDALVSIKEEKLTRSQDGKLISTQIPKNHQAMRFSPDKEKWMQAMKDEIDSHHKSGTWRLVKARDVPPGRKIIGSTWSYDVKRNADGTISRFKARFCAQGFSQLEGWDYHLTYSNTVRLDTLRALMAVAAIRGYRLTGVDVKTAYLNGELKEEIYMKQPPLFEKTGEGGEPMVCKLVKSIYGLKQSGACWEERLVSELTKIGFNQCSTDPCLFKMVSGKHIIFLASYVDDLSMASSCPLLREKVVKDISKVFDLTDTGDLTWLLGTSITQDLKAGTVTLDQSLYIEEMMQIFLPHEITAPRKAPALPCSEAIQNLSSDTPIEKVDSRYRKGVGKLNWLVSVSRPDLAYTLSILARFNNCGGEEHMDAMFKAIRYAYATRRSRLTFRANRGSSPSALESTIIANSGLTAESLEGATLIGYTDSSHGGERPMAGYAMFLFRCLISWAAYRLPHTSLSSCEGEYVAATRATTLISALRVVMEFLNAADAAPTILLCDNQAAVQLSENNTSSKRLKHIATRLAYLREAVKDKMIQLHFVKTNAQLADIFTKPLNTPQFHILRRLLMDPLGAPVQA